MLDGEFWVEIDFESNGTLVQTVLQENSFSVTGFLKLF
jgi:hypothetical protein